MDERVRRRLELRRSNAAVPHRNRYREHKTNPPKPEHIAQCTRLEFRQDCYCDDCQDTEVN